MTETKQESQREPSQLYCFITGVVAGAGLDALMPVDGDGTLLNTVLDATGPAVGLIIYDIAFTRRIKVPNTAAMFAGSLVGQTAYFLLKNYV